MSKFEYEDLLATVEHTVGRLPLKQKKVVEMLMHDNNISQIAASMGLREKTIRNLLSIARKQLRSIMS